MELQKKRNKRTAGAAGEDFAAEQLEKQGFRILYRNFRFGRLGEIDIIAREAEYICFIEVKTRSSSRFGTPGEAVGTRKQETIRRLAMVYLKSTGRMESFIRFDIAEVLLQGPYENRVPATMNLIRNAF